MRRLEGLYAITPDWADGARLLAVSAAILRGGCRCLQYRNKAAAPGQRATQAAALRALAREHDAVFIVNDDVELARAVDADGCHLGADDGDLAAARARLGPHRLLGVSCYQDIGRAEAAVAAGADYVAFGTCFASPTKPAAARADLALFAAARNLGVATAGIGGITRANAAEVIAAGADMVAVISDLYLAPAPEAASRAFCQLFTRKPAS